MGFEVATEAYDRFVGRYSRALAPRFLSFAGVGAGPVLDVGCGPGALAVAIAERFGATHVAAVDTSESFVAGCRARLPDADVRLAPAEALPFADGSFGGALAQLVLSFVDGDRTAAEMRRVLRAGGVAAACSFEMGGFGVVRAFLEAARRLDPSAPDDAQLPYRTIPELAALWEHAGFREIATGTIEVEATYSDFDDWWAPFGFGIGPAAGYLQRVPESRRPALREASRELLGNPAGSFTLPARVIAVRGRR